MTRVHVFCEGQTEDVFVREVLQPYFARVGIWLNPIIVRTGPAGKGGLTSYGKIKWQIEHKCKEDRAAWVTTFFDLYGLPTDFPDMVTESAASISQVAVLEAGFERDIGQPNFLANLISHEFEALLFSAPQAFAAWFDDEKLPVILGEIRNQFDSPEHINNSRHTAPSKRILHHCAGYDKVVHGALIALEIGLVQIRAECPRFDAWVNRVLALAAP